MTKPVAISWNGVPVVVSHVRPPIPIRDHDWYACLLGYEPEPEAHYPYGHGESPQIAIADLLQSLYDTAWSRP